jgi:hypothetical protein
MGAAEDPGSTALAIEDRERVRAGTLDLNHANENQG